MSATILGQSLIGGVMTGSLYGLLALGLTLSWGLLRIVNISHFALAFLAAYITYQLGTSLGVAPWWSACLILPPFFVFGVVLHWVFKRFAVSEMASMLITFGITLFLESIIQWIWSADFRKYESGLDTFTLQVGPWYVPVLDLIGLLCAITLAVSTWAWLRFTFAGKALRASAQDADIAAAFGVDHRKLAYGLAGLATAYAAIAGVFIATTQTLAPAQISSWIGIIFAVVIIGGLGNPLGALGAGIFLGIAESLTMALVNPSWAPLVSFSLLIAILIGRPQWL